MDSTQKQVIALSHKIDGLYEIIERLSEKVSEAISQNQPATETGGSNNPLGITDRYRHSGMSSAMEHKDVLIDVTSMDKYSHQSSEKDLSPEIQIQRLTAQLTAAYNRIAALEEQLLARRINS